MLLFVLLKTAFSLLSYSHRRGCHCDIWLCYALQEPLYYVLSLVDDLSKRMYPEKWSSTNINISLFWCLIPLMAKFHGAMALQEGFCDNNRALHAIEALAFPAT